VGCASSRHHQFSERETTSIHRSVASGGATWAGSVRPQRATVRTHPRFPIPELRPHRTTGSVVGLGLASYLIAGGAAWSVGFSVRPCSLARDLPSSTPLAQSLAAAAPHTDTARNSGSSPLVTGARLANNHHITKRPAARFYWWSSTGLSHVAATRVVRCGVGAAKRRRARYRRTTRLSTFDAASSARLERAADLVQTMPPRPIARVGPPPRRTRNHRRLIARASQHARPLRTN